MLITAHLVSSLFFGLLASPTPAPNLSPVMTEKIEAKVGSEIILTSDVRALVSTLRGVYPNESDEVLTKRALEAHIDRALMRQHLEKVGMSVSDREVESRIQSIRATNGAATNEQFKIMLAAQGLTFEAFREQIKSQIENMQFMSAIRRQSLFTTDEASMRDYYQRNLAEFSENWEIELQECFLDTEALGKDLQKTVQLYVSQPAKFDECVTNLSISPSRESAGKIGKFQQGMLREDIQRRVFPLDKGEVTTVAQAGGVQLLKVVNKINLGPQSFETVKDKIRERLEGAAIQKEMERTMAELRATAFIKI
jgi:peptidyl-prolyl cis-trans isomerase SurA